MIVELYTSAFCGACHSARAVLARAAELVPSARVVEYDVAFDAARSEREGIVSTPTVIVRDAHGVAVFRSAGAPTLPQALSALALAVDA